jgi:hypothetical protein
MGRSLGGQLHACPAAGAVRGCLSASVWSSKLKQGHKGTLMGSGDTNDCRKGQHGSERGSQETVCAGCVCRVGPRALSPGGGPWIRREETPC